MYTPLVKWLLRTILQVHVISLRVCFIANYSSIYPCLFIFFPNVSRKKTSFLEHFFHVNFLLQLRSPAPLRMTGLVWSGVRKAVWGLTGIMAWPRPPCAQKPALLWPRKKCPLPTQKSLEPSEMQPRQKQDPWHQDLMLRDQFIIPHRTPPALWCPDPTQWQVQCEAFISYFLFTA